MYGGIIGGVKTAHVKALAEDFVETYPDRFTEDFQHNKEVLDETGIDSKWLRNRVAGYIVQLVKRRD